MFYWRVIFRDAFLAAVSLNSASFLFSWKDVFVIIVAMLFIDFAIMIVIAFKFIVVSIWALIKKDRQIITKYCYLFELFLLLTFIPSIGILNIVQALIVKFQKLNKKTPSPVGANVQIVQFFEANLGALIDHLLMLTLFIGSFVVHFSRHYPITYKSILPVKVKDERKCQLESRGLIMALKPQYIFSSVGWQTYREIREAVD